MSEELGQGQRRWNGWGLEGNGYPLKPKALAYLAGVLGGLGPILPGASLETVVSKVPTSRLPPHPLVAIDAEIRIRHARGQSFPDWLAMRSGEFGHFPDGVGLPTSSEEVGELLGWAYRQGFIIIVYGGGTSVAGHVTVPSAEKPVITLSLERMSRLLALDQESLIATFGAGTAGPALERQLRERGFVLGHFPQSWELSTVGGWVASRSSGQQSLRYGRIEQLFAGARIETPMGTMTIPDVPASAAGPDLREMILGSEGRIGAITEVKLRVTRLPEHESFHVAFVPDWERGIELVRTLIQARTPLSMLRLSNAAETVSHLALASDHPAFPVFEKAISALGCKSGRRCMLTYGVTGTRRQARFAKREMQRALWLAGGASLASGVMGKIWEHARFRSPYLRNGLWEYGYSVDTLETAVNWSKATKTMSAIETALQEASAGEPVLIFSHLSHMYSQGCSIYTTYIFKNSQTYEATFERWRRYKFAASDAIVAAGGTISHQHGVGRDHAPWLKYEKGEQGLGAISALTNYLDPGQNLNPGCLLED
jgi:alkyldihydroxyacetonephosphate synthase